MDSEQHNKQRAAAIIGLIVIVLVITVAAVSLNKEKQTDSTTTSSVSDQNTQPNQSATLGESSQNESQATSSQFKDGSYEAKGSYRSPGGTESITVKVTLKDGIITDTSAISGATSSTSSGYQEQFIENYKQKVVGKKVDQVSLSKVSGSSLTSQGFNDALAEIRSEAKA